MSGKAAHEGVALLWKISLDNHVSPLEISILTELSEFNAISLDMIFCIFYDSPSSSYNTEAYDEYFDYLWALYESLTLFRRGSKRKERQDGSEFLGKLGTSAEESMSHYPPGGWY